jgi:hypothetical protein
VVIKHPFNLILPLNLRTRRFAHCSIVFANISHGVAAAILFIVLPRFFIFFTEIMGTIWCMTIWHLWLPGPTFCHLSSLRLWHSLNVLRTVEDDFTMSSHISLNGPSSLESNWLL